MRSSIASKLAPTRINQSPSEWEQLEDAEEVRGVLERIQTATRFDVYKCAAQYEMAYPGYKGDADFYVEKGKTGRVLYLGVGTGRIFNKMTEANENIIGLDNSPEMLELLRRRNPRIRKDQALLADATETPISQNAFDTVVAPYSFLQVVEQDKLMQLLQNIRQWLKPNGRFYTDTFSPYLIPFRKKGLETTIQSINEDARTAIYIYILYDHIAQKMKEMALINNDGDERVLEMNLSYYFPHEIIALMKEAGFAEPNIYGGYNGEEFDPSENEVIVYEAQKVPLHEPPYRGNGQLLRSSKERVTA